jgi:hypothetical protein
MLLEEEYNNRIFLKGLRNDFISLLDNGLWSDFKLVVNGVEFAVHSQLLSAKFPFFAALFINAMLMRECKATLEAIQRVLFEVLLKFISF